MLKYILSFVVTIIATAGIDYIWLGKIMKDFYVKEIGKAITPNLTVAALVYVVMALMIFIFVLPLAGNSYPRVIGCGALFGFLAYAFYDLTNMAILSSWSIKLSIVDIAWGTVICAIASVVAYSVLKI